jgi:hypothetical protein
MRPTASPHPTRGPVGFAVGGLIRAEEMEVVGLLRWFKKYAADRFTAPYARTGGFRGRWFKPGGGDGGGWVVAVV